MSVGYAEVFPHFPIPPFEGKRGQARASPIRPVKRDNKDKSQLIELCCWGERASLIKSISQRAKKLLLINNSF